MPLLRCRGGSGSPPELNEIGISGSTGRLQPNLIADAGPWSKLVAGFHHTCGIKTNGRLLCWCEYFGGLNL